MLYVEPKYDIIGVNNIQQETNMRKLLTFYLPRALILLAIIAALALLGTFASSAMSDNTKDIIGYVALAADILLLVCCAGSYILSRRFIKEKHYNINVKAENDRLNARAEEIRADYLKAKQKLSNIRRWAELYVAALVLLSLFCFFCFSMLDTKSIGWMLLPMAVLFSILCRIQPFENRFDWSDYSKREDYPEIYALADKAASAVGIKGDIRIMFVVNGTAAVARIGKRISLMIDVILLSYMRSEELYAILLHEMSHVKNTEADLRADFNFASFLIGDGNINPNLFFAALSYPAMIYSFETTIYKTLSSVVVETEADRAAAKHADKNVAANALYKLECYYLFNRNIGYNMGYNLYEPEECMTDMNKTISDTFLSKMHEMEPEWRHLLEVEIQPRNASHPIFRNRLLSFEADSYALTEPERDGAYRDECRKAMKKIDNDLHKAMSKDYAELREEYYLKPTRIVEKWEENNKEYEDEEARDIINSLSTLGRADEAIAFCTEIIETKTSGLVNYAKFTRGGLYLDRFDPRGIEDIYDALHINNNYIEEGLERIGDFCCLTGDQEGLDRYREESVKYYQQNYDEAGICTLNVTDELSEENVLSAEYRERNLEYIKRIGADKLKAVYLVRKKITETLYSSAYVLEFFNEKEPDFEILDKACVFLDNSEEDWQYSMFCYDKEIAAALKKVPGCCIYRNEKQA